MYVGAELSLPLDDSPGRPLTVALKHTLLHMLLSPIAGDHTKSKSEKQCSIQLLEVALLLLVS